MNRSINFAIVGCGGIARKHAEVLTAHVPGARLVAVCDTNPARAGQFAAAYGVRAYDDLGRMLDDRALAIDAVNILTPSGCHADNVLAAVAHGCRNVVVEKPMALALEDAERMVAACDRAGARLFVVAQKQFIQGVTLTGIKG